MKKNPVDLFRQLRVIPVVVLEEAKDAAPLARALCEGGLPLAEVTFRTAAAPEAIQIMAESCPDLLVGAGTVLTPEQARQAVAAGAEFIVSPGFDEATVEFCLWEQIPVFPGCVTPTEIMKAMRLGLNIVKFFPAENFGGAAAVQALAAPFPGLEFIPTGGVGPENLKGYLEQKAVLACGGSWMVKSSLIREGRFDTVRRLAEEAAALANSCR